MVPSFKLYRPLGIFKVRKTELWIGLLILVVGLSIFQDFLFSRVRDTGFYFSESLLYNSIWLLLAPLSFLQLKLLYQSPKDRLKRFLFMVGLSIALTLFHLLLFASFFTLISNLAFAPSHNFLHIFNAALSNQFYILILFYAFFPVLSTLFPQTKTTNHSEDIKIKLGSKITSVKTDSIQFISTDKPYSVINANDKTYLDGRTLKEFENVLDHTKFARVHRAYIINFNNIKQLNSRRNGDYDALLQNGHMIRLSRHYRSNWEHLLH